MLSNFDVASKGAKRHLVAFTSCRWPEFEGEVCKLEIVLNDFHFEIAHKGQLCQEDNLSSTRCDRY